MAWGTLRQATDEDYARLNDTAQRFAKRHGIRVDESALNEVEWAVSEHDDNAHGKRRLRPLWRRCVRRALRDRRADGIAYGAVGYHVD